MLPKIVKRSMIGRFINWYRYMIIIQDRPSTLYAREYFKNKKINAMELGVLEGINSYSLLKRLNIEKMFLVDSYEDYVMDGRLVTDSKGCFEVAKSLLKPFNDRIVFIRKYSSDAVDDVPDGLDFVYIDANHQYDFVKKDIELYFSKVRVGGIIGGHDFNFVGVGRAVCEFVMDNGQRLFVGDGLYRGGMDWWLIKN